ncbi:hypothetical protein G9A89_000871 [Geosiphon pyriformis]|nr:hypothetical protein G9A89_000871 [Geosiphon pyriformis]
MLITSSSAVLSVLKNTQVIPDVIDEFQELTTLAVAYGGVSPLRSRENEQEEGSLDVTIGNEISMEAAAEAPRIWFMPEENKADSQYALLMVDPDAPSRSNPINGEWRHWVIGNIPANGNLFEGQVLTSYNGPTPPPGTGQHRYVFLLFRQPNKDIDYEPFPEDRRGLKSREFSEKYGLTLIGANMFFCERKSNQ